MKHLLLFLLFTTTLVAQDRVQLEGTILDVTKQPLDGITIFNLNTLEGTVTNGDGIFYMNVRAGDKLSFSALQYDPFTLTITPLTIEKRKTQLVFSQGVNLLDEVVITDQNIRVAVKRTEIPDIELDKVSKFNIEFAAVDRMDNTFSDRIRTPEEMPLVNTAMGQSAFRFNGVDILGLLVDLIIESIFGKADLTLDAPKESEKRFQEVLLNNQYSTDFLADYLNINEEHLFEFMVFAQEEGLNRNMLEPENEFELLQFLDEKGITFKSRLKNRNR